MASRKNWDLTHLTTKYPWLRVDAETIEEFRSPFQWIDAPQKPRQHKDRVVRDVRNDANDSEELERTERLAGDSDQSSSAPSSSDERDDSARFSLSDKALYAGPLAKNGSSTKYTHRHPQRQRRRQRHGRALSPVAKAAVPKQQQSRKYQPSGSREREQPPLSLTVPASTGALYQVGSHQLVSAEGKKKKKRKQQQTKQPHNILSLSFPVLAKTIGAKKAPTRQSLAIRSKDADDGAAAAQTPFAQQLKDLAIAQQRLHTNVHQQIESEKAKLPLAFLFERNLDRSYCRARSVATITNIFAKLQHRLVSAAFDRWRIAIDDQRLRDRQDAARERSQRQALALFERLASDAHVGSLVRAFERWQQCARVMIDEERTHAATCIQTNYRERRAAALRRELQRAAQDTAFKRAAEIAQLLRFEAYGRTMQWTMLRNGFDLLLQHHCARQIQLCYRSCCVRQRVTQRVARRRAATLIQSHWRRVQAQQVRAARHDAKRLLDHARANAATAVQRRLRGRLARRNVAHRRTRLVITHACARVIQRCWCHYRRQFAVGVRFAVLRLLLDAEQARRDALEQQRLQALQEAQELAAACTLQRVVRGYLGRCECRRLRLAQQLERAARRVQTSWRRSKGRYGLQLRFSAQRERIDAQRQYAALTIQCCWRIYCAKRRTHVLRVATQRRTHATTLIQRVVRGRQARQRYTRTRRATLTIQSGMKGSLARRERQRRRDCKLALFRRHTLAATRLQRWTRRVLAHMRIARLEALEAREAELANSAALLIQKHARGTDARRTAQLLRDAMALVELEQTRYFVQATTQCAASPLLQFITTHYLERGRGGSGATNASSSTDRAVRFTHEQCVWLVACISDARTQLAREDASAVLLQRRFRGCIARIDVAVIKMQRQQRRSLEAAMTLRIQRVARGSIARRRVRALQQQQRLTALKDAYVRERKWQRDEQQWKEQYAREQMELQVRRLHAIELELKQAKRDAELAVYHAQLAASVKTQQERLYAAVDLTRGDAASVGSEALLEGWIEAADEYGNVYYFNETTYESLWERPVRSARALAAESVSSSSVAPTTESTAQLPVASTAAEATSRAIDNGSTPPLANTAHGVNNETLGSDRDAYCIECDKRRSTQLCTLCGDGFCAACFAKTHARGNKQHHTWLAHGSFVQRGDWLEVAAGIDSSAAGVTYFNIVTKESTTILPREFQSADAERDAALIPERNAPQQRSISDEVHAIQANDALVQHQEEEPASHPLDAASAAASQSPRIPAATAVGAVDKVNKPNEKRSGGGLLRRLFG